MINEKIENMTPRQRTYALKKMGDRITCMYPFDDSHEYYYVEFESGEILHVQPLHTCKAWDGVSGVQREVRERATVERIAELS